MLTFSLNFESRARIVPVANISVKHSERIESTADRIIASNPAGNQPP